MGFFDGVKKTFKKAVTGKNVFKGTPFEDAARKLGPVAKMAATKYADSYTGNAFSQAGGFDAVVAGGKAAYGDPSALQGVAMSKAKGSLGPETAELAKSVAGSPLKGAPRSWDAAATSFAKSAISTDRKAKGGTTKGGKKPDQPTDLAGKSEGSTSTKKATGGGDFIGAFLRALFGG